MDDSVEDGIRCGGVALKHIVVFPVMMPCFGTAAKLARQK